MTACCGIDVIVFGHPSCELRPAWAASPESAWRHVEADTRRRNDWSRAAWAELKAAWERGTEINGTAPGHAGMPGSGRQAVSGDPGAAHGHASGRPVPSAARPGG